MCCKELVSAEKYALHEEKSKKTEEWIRWGLAEPCSVNVWLWLTKVKMSSDLYEKSFG